jgi:hypothetical protein
VYPHTSYASYDLGTNHDGLLLKNSIREFGSTRTRFVSESNSLRTAPRTSKKYPYSRDQCAERQYNEWTTMVFVGVRSPKARPQFFGSSLHVPDRWQEIVSNAVPMSAAKYTARMGALALLRADFLLPLDAN